MSVMEQSILAGGRLSNWWDEINESRQWQDGVFYFLCAAYALVSSVALVQLIRIQLRVPEFGWTTQKVFHFMNFIVNGVRAIEFGFHAQVFLFRPKARSLATDKLRIVYICVNVVIYVIQFCIWIYLWIHDSNIIELIGKIFIAAISFIAALGFLLYGGRLFLMLRRFPIESKGRRKKLHESIASETTISFIAALGFLLYGGRLFLMLRRFPIESKGRRKKLHEVGSVTAICFTCFLVRCFVVGLSAFDANASLEVLDHPILDLIYYLMTEILPSALVLYILRKLPPKRVSAQYHPIQ
ncbi:hypothetical protein C4D60_Mb08t03210 [Musa balbisiana]|uniref:THH1/TOM1/TOM3 domain-containing protein n=1 Tax=Musa balbisiana TaxID=52838 RepID=A0A4S8K0Z4_MUSBA|nr:hypothetical protein C4D60_Mb08t03210 [Musa balbisiana]